MLEVDAETLIALGAGITAGGGGRTTLEFVDGEGDLLGFRSAERRGLSCGDGTCLIGALYPSGAEGTEGVSGTAPSVSVVESLLPSAPT